MTPDPSQPTAGTNRTRQRPPAPQKRTGRIVAVVALAAIGATLGAVYFPRAAAPLPRYVELPETGATTSPPEFPVPADETDRLRLLVEMLLTADQEDAMWARGQIVATGRKGRDLLREIAQNTLQSNTAFVEHAFDVLLLAPEQGDATLAVEGLASQDPGVVTRSANLLADLGANAPPAAIPALVTAAGLGYPIPQHAATALARIGTRESEAALSALARDNAGDASSRQQCLVALGAMAGEESLATLRAVFLGSEDRNMKLAAAQGLVDRKDDTPLPWLRGEFAKSKDEQALTLLAWAQDEVAFAEIELRLTSPLEDARRRLGALALLERYPRGRKLPLLRKLATESDDDEIRGEAMTQIVTGGDADDEAELLRFLRSTAPGDRGRRERYAAALVVGQLRRPAHAQAIIAVLPPGKSDPKLRIILMRALVLCGSPDGAEAVIREMASDPSEVDADESPSLNLAAQIPGASAAFRKAAAPFIAQALRGEMGPLGPRATFDLIRVAGACNGPEAAPLLEPFLTSSNRMWKEAAAAVLPSIAGDNTLRALRAAWWKPQDAATRSTLRTALWRMSLLRTAH